MQDRDLRVLYSARLRLAEGDSTTGQAASRPVIARAKGMKTSNRHVFESSGARGGFFGYQRDETRRLVLVSSILDAGMMRSRSSKNAVANVLCVWACGAIFGETLGAAIVRKQSFRPENELGSFGFMIYGSKLIEIMTFRTSQKNDKMKKFL